MRANYRAASYFKARKRAREYLKLGASRSRQSRARLPLIYSSASKEAIALSRDSSVACCLIDNSILLVVR